MSLPQLRPAAASESAAVLTKAVLRAAEKLGLSARALAGVLGISEATVSRMRAHAYCLKLGSTEFQLAVLFVRLFRSLDAIVGGDEAVARAWLANPNLAFGGERPVEKIGAIAGLFDVLAYLDARRAVL